MSYEELKISEVNTRNKRKYVSADFDVVLFDRCDVLTGSAGTVGLGDVDGGASFYAGWGAEWEDK